MKRIAKVLSVFACAIAIIISMYTPVEAANFDKAYVQIESYSIEGESVVPGEEFDLKVVLKNTSGTKNIGSCLVTAESKDGVIEPVYGQSNQFFIESIDAGTATEVTLKLKAANGIETLSTPLIFSITYADENTLQNANISTLFLPVSTSGTLKIDNISVPNVATLGTKSRVSITYGNSGADELSNIVLHVVGSRLGSDLEFPLESLAGGDEKYAEAYIDYIAVGEQSIQVSFTYDDVDGLTHETELQNYQVVVSSGSGYQATNVTDITNGSVQNYVIQICVITVIIIILIVLIIIYRKKKNN